MYKLISYLKHVSHASNQHGVHSPFVYDYVTQCLYAKPKYKGSKSSRVLLKSIGYFSAKKIDVLSKNMELKTKVQQEFGLSSQEYGPYDIIYIENISEDVKTILNEKHIHNNTMILLDNIHQNKNTTTLWKNLKQRKEITVTIDLFYCGVVFFRKEQAKEHFKIRI